jgi:osmotically-inducible protein OsmY
MPLTSATTRAAALIAAIALLLYGTSASSQATAPPTGQPPTGQPAPALASTSDEGLTKAVSSALDADPNHYFRHVNVHVDKGVAKLSGYVDSSGAIYRARSIASKVPGITRVETNHLKIDTQLRR